MDVLGPIGKDINKEWKVTLTGGKKAFLKEWKEKSGSANDEITFRGDTRPFFWWNDSLWNSNGDKNETYGVGGIFFY